MEQYVKVRRRAAAFPPLCFSPLTILNKKFAVCSGRIVYPTPSISNVLLEDEGTRLTMVGASVVLHGFTVTPFVPSSTADLILSPRTPSVVTENFDNRLSCTRQR